MTFQRMAEKAKPEKSGSACSVFGEYRLAEENQRFFEVKVFRAMIRME